MASIDPTTLAQQLSQAYAAPQQKILDKQKADAGATNTALLRLQAALKTFNGALQGLSDKKGALANAVNFSVPGVATATAKPSAIASSYSFFVEQVATAHQVAFEDLPATPVSLGGPLVVNMANGDSFTVNLVNADADMNGTLSQAEIGRAINLAKGNGGKVTASVMQSGTKTNLVLTSTQTGEGGKLSIDASKLPAGSLQAAFSAPKELAQARDAIVWLGEQGTGVRLQQASNTVTAIDGVALTLTKAMAPGDAAAVLTVSTDLTATATNMRVVTDAYNILKKTLDELTAIDRSTGKAATFAHDAGVRNLRNRLASLVRQDFGGLRLSDFGVSTARDGQLTLDTGKLEKAVLARGTEINTLLGSQGFASRAGLLGELDVAVDSWTDLTTGAIKQRQDSAQAQDLSFSKRQEKIDQSYQRMYTRYLRQFSQLQALQQQMSGVGDMFTGMLSAKNS